jgi:hypothetical protein
MSCPFTGEKSPAAPANVEEVAKEKSTWLRMIIP